MLIFPKGTSYITWIWNTQSPYVGNIATLTDPIVDVYRVDPSSGNLAIDINLPQQGHVTSSLLSPLDVGTHVAKIDFTGALFTHYVLVARCHYVLPINQTFTHTEQVILSNELQLITNNLGDVGQGNIFSTESFPKIGGTLC
jgi:hypothetical protein